jgi:hypothetical protein
MYLSPYHFAPFVVRIVGIPELAAGRQFKFHKLVTEASLVTNVIPNVKVVVR